MRPHITHHDAINMSAKWILTHGGFFVPDHREPNGVCTYVRVIDGCKIWSYSRLGGCTSYADALHRHKSARDESTSVPYDKTYVAVLEPGDLMRVDLLTHYDLLTNAVSCHRE